jgi:hypothetical protein
LRCMKISLDCLSNICERRYARGQVSVPYGESERKDWPELRVR